MIVIMARFDRLTVYNRMIDSGLIPLYYCNNAEQSIEIARACSEGGATILEFTNRGDFAIDIFRQLSIFLTDAYPNVILGAGSITDPATAALYIACGANFIVAPHLNPEVARLCNQRKIAWLPGCATASEIAQAEELGAEIIKIFPASTVGGPAFIKAILGPSPWSRLMPSSGVKPTEENLSAWFSAGAACVGLGSNLISEKIIHEHGNTKLSERVSEVFKIIRMIRRKMIDEG